MYEVCNGKVVNACQSTDITVIESMGLQSTEEIRENYNYETYCLNLSPLISQRGLKRIKYEL